MCSVCCAEKKREKKKDTNDHHRHRHNCLKNREYINDNKRIDNESIQQYQQQNIMLYLIDFILIFGKEKKS